MSQYPDDANPADLEEQATPLSGGGDEPDETDEPGHGTALGVEPAPHDDVDEADLLEQARPVGGADDDYPNDLEVEPDV